MTGPPDGEDDVGGESHHVFITELDPPPGPGLRLAVKDCIDVMGTVTTAGSVVVAEQAKPAVADAACLSGARDAGVRIVGKTNLHELCFGATGVNPHYGTPANPLDPTRIPGGSSSGSAVAVARGLADVALGTDTAGSVRNPAACCGVVGLKTTFGRIPVTGTRPLAPSLDSIGPIARDVAGATTGMALLEEGFRVATVGESMIRIGRFRGVEADHRIDAAVDAAMAATGLEVVEVELWGWDQAHDDALTLMYAEALETNNALWRGWPERLGSDVHERLGIAEKISSDELAAVRARQRGWQRELAGALDRLDAIVTVGYPRFPSKIDAQVNASNPAAAAVNLAGFPALCLPVAAPDGPTTAAGCPFPASLQLIGPPRGEAGILALGALVEAAVCAGGGVWSS